MTSACGDRSWIDTVSLARMRPHDLDTVLAIERVCFPSAWSRESYLRELQNPNSYYVVARRAGDLIGYGGMWIVEDEAHISTLAVHPNHRRRGLGRHLVSHLIHVARGRGAAVITLEVRENNSPAQALYRGLGFLTTGRLRNYYIDTGENGLLMRRDLSPGGDDGQST